MKQHIALVALVVPDYDEAIDFYVGTLGFTLVEDTPLPLEGEKRWVVVRPPGATETGLLLARGVGEKQLRSVGNQTGGRVGFFLYTDDFAVSERILHAGGVRIVRPPVDQPYGRVLVFADPYGNLWDLIEPTTAQ